MFVDGGDVIRHHVGRRLPELLQFGRSVGFWDVERSLLSRVEKQLHAFDLCMLVFLCTPGERCLLIGIIAQDGGDFGLFETLEAYDDRQSL